MSLTVETATRAFKFSGRALQDPDIKMTPQQVKDFYAGIYPELTNAEIEGPDMKGAVAHYEFRKAVGTKGTDLRTRLQSLAAGQLPQLRGNVVRPDDAAAAAPLATACRRLIKASEHDGERVTAPAELLTILP